jgi:RimJ/RimL family protein N-acetyltransferase
MTFACETMPRAIPAQVADSFAALIPTLETERLTLRAPTPADFPLYADIMCGPRSDGMGGPYSREDAWWDFAQLASGWVLHGHGGWAVTTKDGALIGFALIGFEPGDQEPELGYLFAESAEGNGYATEAAGAVKAYAFNDLRLPTLVSYITIGNARSERVAERLGATKQGTLTFGDDTPVSVFRHPNPNEVR